MRVGFGCVGTVWNLPPSSLFPRQRDHIWWLEIKQHLYFFGPCEGQRCQWDESWNLQYVWKFPVGKIACSSYHAKTSCWFTTRIFAPSFSLEELSLFFVSNVPVMHTLDHIFFIKKMLPCDLREFHTCADWHAQWQSKRQKSSCNWHLTDIKIFWNCLILLTTKSLGNLKVALITETRSN